MNTTPKRHCLILAALLVLLVCFFGNQHRAPVSQPTLAVLDAKPPARLTPAAVKPERVPVSAESLVEHADVVFVANRLAVDPRVVTDRAVKTDAIMQGKNVDVKFYGKVLDQNDQPLAGVVIQAHSREWGVKNLFEPKATFHRKATSSDADGRFNFDSLHGDTFVIDEMRKPGYVLSPRAVKGFSYGPLRHHFVPSALEPVIYRMWKTNGAAPLYVVSLQGGIPQDGTVLGFDLRRNKRVRLPVHDTDIRIILKQSAPPGQRGYNPHFDWSFTLEVPDGGVIETRDEFMYLAPEQGYQSNWVAEYRKDDPDWKARREVSFYLRNRGGQQYGRMEMTFTVNATGEGYIAIEGFLNPAGRVLEYDVRKKLYPAPEVPLRPGYTPPGQPVRPAGSPFAPGSTPPQGIPTLPPGMQPPPGFQALTNRPGPFAPPAPQRPR